MYKHTPPCSILQRYCVCKYHKSDGFAIRLAYSKLAEFQMHTVILWHKLGQGKGKNSRLKRGNPQDFVLVTMQHKNIIVCIFPVVIDN